MKHIIPILLLISIVFPSRGNAQINVALDNYFNHEIKAKTGKAYHYLWSDTANSGYSKWGSIFRDKGAHLSVVTHAPTPTNLKDKSIYIIVDPDTPKESPDPNYITETESQVIEQWVRKGGVLVIMANGQGYADLHHLNILSDRFGIHFNSVVLHQKKNHHWNVNAFTKLPNHPVFNGVHKIFMLEISSISITGRAQKVLRKGNNTIIAESEVGEGFVFAVADPWLYNEYIDHKYLPKDFQNRKAAQNLTNYLIKKIKE